MFSNLMSLHVSTLRNNCLPVTPFAPPAFTGFNATMERSDFCQLIGFSPVVSLQSPYCTMQELADLPGMQQVLCVLAMFLDPGGLHAIQVSTDDTYHRPAS